MKKYIILTAIIIGILFISSCKKDNTEPTATMSAKVDGVAWTTITRVTKHYANTNSFVITGTSVTGEVLIITVKSDQEGTYTSSTSIDSVSAQVGCVWQPDATSPTTDNYLSKKGTVNITEINAEDLRISGTFNFDLIKTDSLGVETVKTITEGEFSNLSYSESN